ncbi:hypothetical protein GCM10028857_05970 [Salinarchaeum chitinilyticum]
MVNATPESQSLEVSIVRDGERRFEERYNDVPAWGTDPPAPDRQNPSTHLIDPARYEGSGAYELRARFLTPSHEWQTFDLDEADAEYVGVDVYFGTRDTISPSIYRFETEAERAEAREFIRAELESQSERDRYGTTG